MEWIQVDATGCDQSVGYGMMGFAGFVFTYYTLWVIILPFVESDHPIHSCFLPRDYALIIPIVAGVMVLICLVTFIGVILSKSKSAKPKSS